MKNFINNILLITGTYPPERCGVGDYCWNLINSTTGTKWEILISNNWSLKTIVKKIVAINRSKSKVVNIQYPSMGYKRSLLPHLICVYIRLFTKKEVSVTFHEFCQMQKKGRIAAYIFFIIFANKIIFTTEAEKYEVEKQFPKLKTKKVNVIRIFSNIPKSNNADRNIEQRQYDVVYFGYIRPQKGLEEFLSVCKILKSNHPLLRIIVIGRVQKEFCKYAEKILQEIDLQGFIYEGNLSENEAADKLADCKIAYLPYPDGVSERRGTLLAALINGCAIVSTKGTHSTKFHEEICFLNNTITSLEIIEALLSGKIEKKNSVITATEIPLSWDDVKKQYEIFLLP